MPDRAADCLLEGLLDRVDLEAQRWEEVVRTYSHGESTTEIIQDDPRTWVPTVIHGHGVLRSEEAVGKIDSRIGTGFRGRQAVAREALWMSGGWQKTAQKGEGVDVVESLTGGLKGGWQRWNESAPCG